MNSEYTDEQIQFLQDATHDIYVYALDVIKKKKLHYNDMCVLTSIFTGLISCSSQVVNEEFLETYLFSICQTIRQNYKLIHENENLK